MFVKSIGGGDNKSRVQSLLLRWGANPRVFWITNNTKLAYYPIRLFDSNTCSTPQWLLLYRRSWRYLFMGLVGRFEKLSFSVRKFHLDECIKYSPSLRSKVIDHSPSHTSHTTKVGNSREEFSRGTKDNSLIPKAVIQSSLQCFLFLCSVS